MMKKDLYVMREDIISQGDLSTVRNYSSTMCQVKNILLDRKLWVHFVCSIHIIKKNFVGDFYNVN